VNVTDGEESRQSPTVYGRRVNSGRPPHVYPLPEGVTAEILRAHHEEEPMRKHLVIATLFVLSISTSAFAADAAEIFKAKCSSCHGEDGKAKTKMGAKEKIPDFTTDKFQAGLTDDKLKDAITNGVPDTKMKAFNGKLTAEEIASLVKLVRGFKGK
jgi:cytochrome c553